MLSHVKPRKWHEMAMNMDFGDHFAPLQVPLEERGCHSEALSELWHDHPSRSSF